MIDDRNTTNGHLTTEYLEHLTPPFDEGKIFEEFLQTDLGQDIMSNLWVNCDRDAPDFSNTKFESRDIEEIPISIVGIQGNSQ